MAIDAATVRKVAHLARIKTPEDRLEPLAQELNGILNWIEQLNEVDVQGVEPMTSNVAQPCGCEKTSSPTAPRWMRSCRTPRSRRTASSSCPRSWIKS